jgi:hypothetical protein
VWSPPTGTLQAAVISLVDAITAASSKPGAVHRAAGARVRIELVMPPGYPWPAVAGVLAVSLGR